MSPSSNIPRLFDMLRQLHGGQVVPLTRCSLITTTGLDLQRRTVPLPHSISMGLASGMPYTFNGHPVAHVLLESGYMVHIDSTMFVNISIYQTSREIDISSQGQFQCYSRWHTAGNLQWFRK